MLQKGIIETIIDKYTVKVRIPKYDKIDTDATSTKTEDLAVGILCTLPGMKITYAIGDVVLVDFENDELNRPVVLGLLYREKESDSVLKLSSIDDSIESINRQLEDINSLSLHTHIKYSNDNGMTFTSLYDPTEIIENYNQYTGSYYLSSKEPIQIDNKTKVIYWSIIDNNNVDVTNNININTKITGINSNGEKIVDLNLSTKLFELPFETILCKEVYIEFELYLTTEEVNNYYICLTTDLESIGSVYGDYIGICVSNENEPSLNIKDYTWTSIINRNNITIQNISEKLLNRIQENEKDIRGYSEDIIDNSGEVIKSGIALLDAIVISLNTIILGINRKTIYFGTKDQYIDIYDSSIHVNSLIENDFKLTRREINNTPYLTLYYIND